MKVLAVIDQEPIIEHDDGSVTFRAKAAIDSDGVGPHHGDKTAQNETTYKPDLNADIDKYVVIPPAIRDGVKGIVIGCQAIVRNSQNAQMTYAVVGDIGPHHKLGEISCACAKALGLDPSPVDGGTDDHIIFYQIFPGTPAKHFYDLGEYTLQPKLHAPPAAS